MASIIKRFTHLGMLNRITKGAAIRSKTMTKICGKNELVLFSTSFATYYTVYIVWIVQQVLFTHLFKHYVAHIKLVAVNK